MEICCAELMAPFSGRYLLAAQALALLVTAGTWWRAWMCLCEATLVDAAFWTAVTLAQSVVVIGVLALRSR
jgi:hypothetical protein